MLVELMSFLVKRIKRWFGLSQYVIRSVLMIGCGILRRMDCLTLRVLISSLLIIPLKHLVLLPLPILCNGGKLSQSFPFQTRSRFSLGSYITTSFLLIKIYMLGRFSWIHGASYVENVVNLLIMCSFNIKELRSSRRYYYLIFWTSWKMLPQWRPFLMLSSLLGVSLLDLASRFYVLEPGLYGQNVTIEHICIRLQRLKFVQTGWQLIIMNIALLRLSRTAFQILICLRLLTTDLCRWGHRLCGNFYQLGYSN